jgi:hypothetical protein
MRVNTAKTLAAWNAHRPLKIAESIWTDGERIMSYGTCIVERHNEGDRDITYLNVTKYSVTTTIHQNALRPIADKTVSHIPMGSRHLAA